MTSYLVMLNAGIIARKAESQTKNQSFFIFIFLFLIEKSVIFKATLLLSPAPVLFVLEMALRME